MTLQDAYRQGYEAGLGAYAWWKDGAQWVGTSGTTLKEAVAKMEHQFNYHPPKNKIEATGIILHRGGKIALSERLEHYSFPGQLQCPGGKVDATDNSLEEAARRELLEETGLNIELSRFQYMTSINEDGFICAFFKVHTSLCEEPKNTEPGKHGDWRWYSVEEAMTLPLMSGLRQALEVWRF